MTSKREKCVPRNPRIPKKGEIFSTNELNKIFCVATEGGIRYSTQHNYVLLVDDRNSDYEDFINIEDQTVIYKGTGSGNQSFEKRWSGAYNRKVKDPDSILLYFGKTGPNLNVFKFHVKYVKWWYGHDKEKNRREINFKLKIIK